MTKIFMLPVVFAVTAFAFCCLAWPFLVLAGSFVGGFAG